jgi:anti-sigma regulatory factor (Ser/Thr protein kinase)
LKIILFNEKRELERMQAAVDTFSVKNNLPAVVVNGLQLALEELFINVILYAFETGGRHRITLLLTMSGSTLDGELGDDGRPFDPTAYPEPDLDGTVEARKIGGLGIHLARRFFDEWKYERLNDKNILTFKKTVKYT